jgi:hypothetical protein
VGEHQLLVELDDSCELLVLAWDELHHGAGVSEVATSRSHPFDLVVVSATDPNPITGL